MSVPIQSGSIQSAPTVPSGVTSPVFGQINYGWISDAWRLFSTQMGIWIVATLILFVPVVVSIIVFYALMWATMFPGGFPPAASQAMPPGSTAFPAPLTPGISMNSRMGWMFPAEIGFGLVYSVWSAYLYGGMFRMAVRQVRGLPIEMRDIFRGGPLFGRMLGAIFLLGFGTYGLEALCLAPFGLLTWQHGPVAALAATGTLLPSFALMADGEGVIMALKRSIRGMKHCWPAAAGFVFVLGILVYASELPCGIGLLATIPMTFLICALAYRDMLGMPNMVALPAYGYPPAEAGVWPPPPSFPQERN